VGLISSVPRRMVSDTVDLRDRGIFIITPLPILLHSWLSLSREEAVRRPGVVVTGDGLFPGAPS
jgi:hypothetical protein